MRSIEWYTKLGCNLKLIFLIKDAATGKLTFDRAHRVLLGTLIGMSKIVSKASKERFY